MALTGKQKRALKARGQTMADDARLGKEGLTAGFVAHLGALLADRELVKVRFADAEGSMRKQIAAQIAGAVGGECVGIVGRTMLLWRAKRDDAGDAIEASVV